jgi:hypothetical protein
LRRNLQIKNEQTKSMAYKSLVRSNLEYCWIIWSPHTKKQKSEIEKVRLRAARYKTGRFHNNDWWMICFNECCDMVYRVTPFVNILKSRMLFV